MMLGLRARSWVKKGLTCEDCAWEEYCIDYFDTQGRVRVEEIHILTEVEILEHEQDYQAA
jgi:hypothetical protein